MLSVQELSWECLAYFEVSFVDNQFIEMEKKIEKFTDSAACPVRNVLDRFGDKWSVLILLSLDEKGTLRFNELHKMIETISQKMLAVTLKTLEADGLVSRTIYPQIPPKVEYELTERGKSLLPHIHSLVQWSLEHMDAIQTSRLEYSA